MFKITMGKGMHITFENGYSISIQFGPGNYCENYNMPASNIDAFHNAGKRGSKDAECAVFDPSGEFIEFPGSNLDVVKGRMSADEVGDLIAWVKSR